MDMGKLIVDMSMTLDGVVQSPGGPEEDPSGRFKHGGWQAPFFGGDKEAGAVLVEGIQRSDALLLGRRTYEIFASYWPKADGPIAAKFNAMPKYVASRTMKRAEWGHTSVLGPDLPREIARLKERHGEVHVWGSTDLAQSLLRERLVDRLNLWFYPLTLGTGKRLFGEGTVPTAFKLVRSRAFGNGLILATYEAAGEPTYGGDA
jgi:dihydrofolate reductase